MDSAIRDFLESNYLKFNSEEFITSDPVSIPHQFSRKEDIEISGFLAATLAWGQRPVIIRNANEFLRLMDHAPYEFILQHSSNDLRSFDQFVHRTFNGVDAVYFIRSLKNIYQKYGSMEPLFKQDPSSILPGIRKFRKAFFELKHPSRTTKHISDPDAGSACKRINMFLRWMVRNDKRGVDFGLWNISPSLLMCPLDVHSGNMARQLKLLGRKQNDWKAVEELTSRLREFDPDDPVKYDFALFGADLPVPK